MLVLRWALCLAYLVGQVSTYCHDKYGNKVAWWLLYQQKDRPFLHFYTDSSNPRYLKEHFPEKHDSALSRTMSQLLSNEDSEYIVYSSDIVNAKKISEDSPIPTYSKWMHGIMGTKTSWDSGFWILHNNLLFPPVKNNRLVAPGSSFWTSTTLGDSTADIFYVCVSSENKKSTEEMLENIMAGNPFIHHRKLSDQAMIHKYFNKVQPLQTSFGSEWSAMLFLNCLYSSKSNASENCLFKYVQRTGVKLTIMTRPRGMIRHGSSFCYNENTRNLFESVQLDDSLTSRSLWTGSIFALSGDSSSSIGGVTCFGQDIAANTETVAVMICVNLPSLYMNLLKTSRVTTWACGKTSGPPKYENNRNSYKTNSIRMPEVGELHMDAHTVLTDEDETEEKVDNNVMDDEEIKSEATDDPDEKGVAKFCLINNCDGGKEEEDDGKGQRVLKNPLLKTQKMAKWYEEKIADISILEHLHEPKKVDKSKDPPKHLIRIKNSGEVEKYLTKNEDSVLGIFCQQVCPFCQKAQSEITMLGEALQVDHLDVVYVNVDEHEVPSELDVYYTPFVRFKESGVDGSWIDFEEDFGVMNVLTFLSDVAKVDTSNIMIPESDQSNTDTAAETSSSNTRRRRDTRYVQKLKSAQQLSRKKRSAAKQQSIITKSNMKNQLTLGSKLISVTSRRWN